MFLLVWVLVMLVFTELARLLVMILKSLVFGGFACTVLLLSRLICSVYYHDSQLREDIKEV